ncbi:MAG: hypothetical protein IJ795_04465 [Bacteroidales bacterium]|nr:hypothetical protein [Bacteroidales bacterium]
MTKGMVYSPPAIIREVELCLEAGLLAGSVVTKETKIETAGQHVEKRDFNSEGFNSTWE